MKQMFNRYDTTQKITEQFAGKRQGTYTILYAIRKKPTGKKGLYVHFVCQCDCGKQITVMACDFKRLHKCQSCCQKTHGKSYTKLYKSYTCMKERCYYPHNNRYYKYGARGIRICDEWLQDRETFFEWAYAHGYKDGLSIDRIDVDGNYCPENCRWATNKQQARNKSTTVWVEHKGKRLCLQDWADKLGISRETLSHRLKSGWSVEKTLTTPVKKGREFIQKKGEQNDQPKEKDNQDS